MKLIDIIEEIRRRKDWDKQTFAAAVKVDKTLMSKMGMRWEQHWMVIQRILDLCEELGIDPYADKPGTYITVKEFRTRVEAILTRLMLHEKPRQQLKKQIIEMVEGAYEKAQQKRGENPGVSFGNEEDQSAFTNYPADRARRDP